MKRILIPLALMIATFATGTVPANAHPRHKTCKKVVVRPSRVVIKPVCVVVAPAPAVKKKAVVRVRRHWVPGHYAWRGVVLGYVWVPGHWQ